MRTVPGMNSLRKSPPKVPFRSSAKSPLRICQCGTRPGNGLPPRNLDPDHRIWYLGHLQRGLRHPIVLTIWFPQASRQPSARRVGLRPNVPPEWLKASLGSCGIGGYDAQYRARCNPYPSAETRILIARVVPVGTPGSERCSRDHAAGRRLRRHLQLSPGTVATAPGAYSPSCTDALSWFPQKDPSKRTRCAYQRPCHGPSD